MAEKPARQIVVADRYRLERRLARGGMATVHLAHDEVLDRPVALKIMLARLAQDETFVARFQREAQSAAKLNHPNIVAVYDWGGYEDTYFIAMEYVEGETLADRLKSHGPLPPEEATRVAIDVAKALDCAHRQATVHRDIKPANILLSSTGSAKVTDFGIARAFDGDVDLTEVGKVLGTALYFSPEQARGERVGPPSDLYSLGVMLFEILTGKPPFGGASTLDVALKHIENTPPLASSKASSIPGHLDAIVDRLLVKNPDDRYQSAADLVADLTADDPGRLAIAHRSVDKGEEAEDQEPDDAALTLVDALGPAALDDPATSVLDPPTSTPTASTTAAIAVSSETEGRQLDGAEPAGDEPSGDRSGFFVAAAVLVLVATVALTVLVTQALTADNDSARPAMLVVPSVIGEPQAAAVQILSDAGFEPAVSESPNDGAAPGVVFGQTPAGLTQAPEGSPVAIVIAAAGESPGQAPAVTEAAAPIEPPAAELLELVNVVGNEEADASQQLAGLGFTVVIEPVDVDPATPTAGKVRSQDPPAGAQVPSGSTITLVVERPLTPDGQPANPDGDTTTTVEAATTSTPAASSEPSSPPTAEPTEPTGQEETSSDASPQTAGAGSAAEAAPAG